jgi:hypothetical protein
VAETQVQPRNQRKRVEVRALRSVAGIQGKK